MSIELVRGPGRAARNVNVTAAPAWASIRLSGGDCLRGTTVDILLLEDAPGDVKLFASLLRGDVSITVASNGAEALDYVFRRGRFKGLPAPDLIVVDLNVPLLNGHEVLNVIKSNSATRHLPVVVWSGSDNPDDIQRAYDLGCCAYMLKLASLPDMEAQLSAFTNFWVRAVRYPCASHADMGS